MNKCTKNSIFKVAILTLVMLVGLPCAAKRELKLAFDIPISHVDTKPNVDQSISCGNTLFSEATLLVEENTVQLSLFCIFDTSFESAFSSVARVVIDEHIELFDIPQLVPIYIIHQRYRI